MENLQHFVAITKLLVLDVENYCWWKVQIKSLIMDINEDDWTAVEEG